MKYSNNLFKIFCLVGILSLLTGCRTVTALYKGNTVKVAGIKGQWRLLVNDKELRLKGVGVGEAFSKEGGADLL